MTRSVDVAVVGAGIPGLALAVALQQRKISTVLLDGRKAADTSPRGLTLQPNGMDALDRLGVMEDVRRTSSPASIFEIRNRNGELLLEIDYGLLDHPFNYLLTVNSSELEGLLRHRAERAGAEIVWGARFRELLRADGGVKGVVFESEGNTDEIRSSLVVGADGSQSRVRTAIATNIKSHKYKDAFVAGLVGLLPELHGRARQYQGPGLMLGMMPMTSMTSVHHCVGKRTFEEVKHASTEDLKAEVAQTAPELAEPLRNIDLWKSFSYFQPSWTRVQRWVDDGVVLLGDSAHTFHPHSGQGLNLSLQDSLALAETIENCRKTGDFSGRALQEYESKRMVFADVIGRHAHYSATYALSGNFLIRRLNRRALGKLRKNPRLLKRTLELTAGTFDKKPGLWTLAKIGGILP